MSALLSRLQGEREAFVVNRAASPEGNRKAGGRAEEDNLTIHTSVVNARPHLLAKALLPFTKSTCLDLALRLPQERSVNTSVSQPGFV